MKKVKLLHCGDLHLDAPFTSLADRDGRPEQRRRELRNALAAIIALAAAEHVDMLLVCGDLYEYGYARKGTFHFICEQFRKIPDIPVLIIPGNHDPLAPDSFYSGSTWPENVRILKDGTDFYEHTATGTYVFVNIPPSGFRTGLMRGAQTAGNMPSSCTSTVDAINILMLHGTLDMPFSADAYQPVSSSELDSLGFDYYALGHFHSRIQEAGRSRRIYNAGSPEPLGFDEEGEHGAFIATIEKNEIGESKIDVVFRKLCKRRFINLEVQVGGCLTDEQVSSVVASAIEKAGSNEDLYRIMLTGYVNRSFRADTSYIADLLKDKAFYIKIIDNTMPDYDFDMIADEPGLRGLFVRKMLDRAAAAPDEEGRRLAMRALYYGMEAIDEGSVCV